MWNCHPGDVPSTTAVAAQPVAPTDSSELKILALPANNQTGGSLSGQPNDGQNDQLQSLRRQLLAIEEENQSIRQENDSLKSRLKETNDLVRTMKQQLDELNKLVKLQNEQLTVLQTQVQNREIPPAVEKPIPTMVAEVEKEIPTQPAVVVPEEIEEESEELEIAESEAADIGEEEEAESTESVIADEEIAEIVFAKNSNKDAEVSDNINLLDPPGVYVTPLSDSFQ